MNTSQDIDGRILHSDDVDNFHENDENENENEDEDDAQEDLVAELEDSHDESGTPISRCSEKMNRFMIKPTNRKLKMFHLLVSVTLYVDITVTGFILGNYRFQIGEDVNFLEHEKIYTMIIVV